MHPALLAAKPIITQIMKYLIPLMIAKEAKDTFMTVKGQSRSERTGQAELDFLKQKLGAEQSGQEMLLSYNEKQTEKLLARLMTEKNKESTERRIERADILKSQNEQQQMQLLAMLMQGIGQRNQQNVQTQSTLAPRPPISMSGLMRGEY